MRAKGAALENFQPVPYLALPANSPQASCSRTRETQRSRTEFEVGLESIFSQAATAH
jgi:hypothetical protein